MNSKLWLKSWLTLFFIFIINSFIFIFYIYNYKNVPLRFTNSISFDAKLSFLKKSEKLNDVEILIIGSSMGLNNINSIVLSQNLGNKILNLSSWGLKTNEIYEFLKILDLSKIKKIIYLNQYFDFYGESISSYDSEEIKNYLYNESLLPGYINTFFTLNSNFKDYIYWKNNYLDETKYSNLRFNEYGDIGLKINKENIDQGRWNKITDTKELSINYNSLEDMIVYFQKNDIEFYLVTTPYRQKFFSEDKFLNQYNKYINKIYSLKSKYNFNYINLHDRLNLTDIYFTDSSHLNFEGSNLVSKELLKSINK